MAYRKGPWRDQFASGAPRGDATENASVARHDEFYQPFRIAVGAGASFSATGQRRMRTLRNRRSASSSDRPIEAISGSAYRTRNALRQTAALAKENAPLQDDFGVIAVRCVAPPCPVASPTAKTAGCSS